MTQQMTDRIEEFREIVEKVAYFATSGYYDIPREDIEQELFIEVLKNDNISLENAWAALENAGARAVRQMRGEQLEVSVQYSYVTRDVEKMLETLFDYELWQQGWVPEDMSSESGNDSVAARSDVMYAFEMLHPSYQGVILRRYQDGVLPGWGTPERQRLERGVEKLMEKLNSYGRGDRRRKVMTNARANHIIDNQ